MDNLNNSGGLSKELKNVGSALDMEKVVQGITPRGSIPGAQEPQKQEENLVLEEPKDDQKSNVSGTEGEQKMSSENTDGLKERVEKMENVLQEFGKFFMNYKEENSKRISELSEAVSAFRNELLNMKTKQTSAPAQQPAQATPSQKPAQQANPRTGDSKSEDVDINEIFSNAHGRLMKK